MGQKFCEGKLNKAFHNFLTKFSTLKNHHHQICQRCKRKVLFNFGHPYPRETIPPLITNKYQWPTWNEFCRFLLHGLMIILGWRKLQASFEDSNASNSVPLYGFVWGWIEFIEKKKIVFALLINQENLEKISAIQINSKSILCFCLIQNHHSGENHVKVNRGIKSRN